MSIARNRPEIVYHYCSLDTDFWIFSNSTIRLSNISKSNDSQEITYLIPKMKQFCNNLFSGYNEKFSKQYKLNYNFVEKLFEYKFNEMSLNFYVLCFSEETDSFYPLARSIRSNYNFSQVKYLLDDLYDQIKNYVIEKVEKNFGGDEKKDSLELLNIADTTVSMLLYNSILYKNPNFYEEKEWRLIYNPFGNIRRISDKYSYYDRMYESFNRFNEKGDFVRNPMTFHISKDKMISHIDLSFDRIKGEFIKEIIIGAKADINDLDLELFLLSNGFNPLKIYTHKSDIPYR